MFSFGWRRWLNQLTPGARRGRKARAPRPSFRPCVDLLERRWLPSTTIVGGGFGDISGIKFDDTNANGVKDLTETGLGGWSIELHNLNTGALIATATTDNVTGNYTFLALPAGSYEVKEDLKPGWTQTAPAPNGSPPTPTYKFFLQASTTSSANNFGNFQPSSISGQKFDDINGNGVKDPGDFGLPSWTIHLDGTDINNQPVHRTTTTNGSGNCSFTNLLTGSYTVSEELKPGYGQSAPPTGSYFIAVTEGTSHPGQDFGNFRFSTISGRKFNDLNDSGVNNPSNPGLPNWAIELAGTDNLGNIVDTATFTDANGNYSFTNVAPGTYEIEEEVQSGWTQTFPGPQVDDNQEDSDTDVDEYHVAVTEDNSTITGQDFGNFHPGQITGQKFDDLNGNGRKDPGEPGLAGWTITLDEGPSGFQQTTTDEFGNYTFTDLLPGTYEVEEEQQPGWIQTFPAPFDGDPEGDPPSLDEYTVVVVSNSDIVGRDFGNFQAATVSGGHKYNDLNGNQRLDPGEPPLPGWVINIDGTNSMGQTVHQTATTDSGGNYSFVGLLRGTYRFSEVVKTGWKQTAIIGNRTIVIGPNAPPNSSGGQTVTGPDFLNFKFGVIHGQKFNDVNGNRIKDPGEQGLAGWVITLTGTDVNGKVVNRTTTTNASGFYSFVGLDAGTYKVKEVLQPGWTPTLPPGGSGAYNDVILSGSDIINDFGNRLSGGTAALLAATLKTTKKK
jgi:SdrD B-like domain